MSEQQPGSQPEPPRVALPGKHTFPNGHRGGPRGKNVFSAAGRSESNDTGPARANTTQVRRPTVTAKEATGIGSGGRWDERLLYWLHQWVRDEAGPARLPPPISRLRQSWGPPASGSGVDRTSGSSRGSIGGCGRSGLGRHRSWIGGHRACHRRRQTRVGSPHCHVSWRKWSEHQYPRPGVPSRVVLLVFLGRTMEDEDRTPVPVTSPNSNPAPADLYTTLDQHCALEAVLAYMATKSGFAAAVLEGSLLQIPVTAAVPVKTGDASSPVFAGSPPCWRGAGASLRLPGQFFNQVQDRLPEPTNYVNQVRAMMDSLRPEATRTPNSSRPHVSENLTHCTHVFVRHGPITRSLQAPYAGPFRVLKRRPKHFTLQIRGQEEVICLDRLKPAHIKTSPPRPMTTELATNVEGNHNKTLSPSPFPAPRPAAVTDPRGKQGSLTAALNPLPG
ncbi:hypothetical protein ISCGN_007559 [Ixodes scapularis]